MEPLAPIIDQEKLSVSNSRIFDAPKNLVFKAWSDPELIKHWWGPNGFTNTFETFDFKAEGDWRFTMHGPNGANFPNYNRFYEIAENEKIILDHISGHKFRVTATFQEVEQDKTKLTFTQVFSDAQEFETILKIVPEANEQNFNRLEVQVAKQLIHPKPLVQREFKAPMELVFKAFTEAEHLVHWWGAPGFRLTIKELEVRPNGFFQYKMHSDNGIEMWGKFEYFQVHPSAQLVFTSSFANEEGELVPAPFFDVWPAKILNVWTFTESEGKTVLTLKGAPFKATEEQIKAYKDNIPSMEQGFSGTFDKLEDYLETIINTPK